MAFIFCYFDFEEQKTCRREPVKFKLYRGMERSGSESLQKAAGGTGGSVGGAGGGGEEGGGGRGVGVGGGRGERGIISY
jgi:hypothetical protein